MFKQSAFWLFLILLLSGCALIPTNIVNEINMAQGVAYDWDDKKDIKGTFVFPIFKKDNPTSSEAKSAIGRSSKDIRAKISRETRYRLVSGQLRLSLYGRSLAKKGLNDFVDTLNRDPSIGNQLQLAVVDGNANEILKIKKYKTENVSIYLQEMLDQNMQFGALPQSDLQTFLFQLFQKGQDPYLPLIKKESDDIRIIGLALFKDDRFTTSISTEDLFIFKGLVDTYKHGTQQFNLNNGEKVVLDILKSHAKYNVKIVKGVPEFSIKLIMKSRLQEFSSPKEEWVTIDKKKTQKLVEREIEKRAIKMITHFKNRQVDPLGLGAKYKEHYRRFNEKKWKAIYPQVKVQVHAKVEIKQTGIVD